MEKTKSEVKSGKFDTDMSIDPLFMAMMLFRHRRFEDCLEICNELLTKNPKDQVYTYYELYYTIYNNELYNELSVLVSKYDVRGSLFTIYMI